MDEKANVSEQLKSLIEIYDFNVDTLSKYLEIPVEQVENIAHKNIDSLPEEPAYRFRIFTKIQFLYFCAIDDKDLKLSAFLKVLISHHNLSKKTIAKMADVEVKDIEKILSNNSKNVESEIKYKIAVTVMTLRFFLKDCEPTV